MRELQHSQKHKPFKLAKKSSFRRKLASETFFSVLAFASNSQLHQKAYKQAFRKSLSKKAYI